MSGGSYFVCDMWDEEGTSVANNFFSLVANYAKVHLKRKLQVHLGRHFKELVSAAELMHLFRARLHNYVD